MKNLTREGIVPLASLVESLRSKHARTAFAGIEKLIEQAILILEVSLERVFDPHGRQSWLQTHCAHDRVPFDVPQHAVCDYRDRRYASSLASKTAVPKENPRPQQCQGLTLSPSSDTTLSDG
jgi:hypothetical protein